MNQKLVTNVDDIKPIKTFSKSERETVIRFDEELNIAEIYTTSNIFMTKMKRAMKANPEEFKCNEYASDDCNVMSYLITCPKKYIAVRTKSKKRAPMSEEQRAKVAERFRKNK